MNLNEVLIAKFPNAFKAYPPKIILQDDGEGIYIKEWNLEELEPTAAELGQWAIELEDEVYNNTQRELRRAAYPSLEDQLDMQYHDAINNTTIWVEAVEAVKLQYPFKVNNVD